MGPKAKGGEVQMGSKGETPENFYSMLPIYDYGFFVFEDRGYLPFNEGFLPLNEGFLVLGWTSA